MLFLPFKLCIDLYFGELVFLIDLLYQIGDYRAEPVPGSARKKDRVSNLLLRDRGLSPENLLLVKTYIIIFGQNQLELE